MTTTKRHPAQIRADAVTLDQLRTFIAAVDEGSFSAAGRRLKRAQSVISQTLANLESQLSVRLFDRSGRIPVLTEQGRALIAEARAVADSADLFKARARGLAGGLELELPITVDVMFPIVTLTRAVAAFQEEFPGTQLRLNVEALGAVLQPVLDGRCIFGIMGSLPMWLAPPQLSYERLFDVKLATVVSPLHPLAVHNAPIRADLLSQHTQLVITDRSDLSRGREFGVISPKTWRLADLGAKHAFLRDGLGWGFMPFGLIEPDLANGTLVEIAIEEISKAIQVMPMSAAYRTDTPPGPGGRWLIERLKRPSTAHEDTPALRSVLR
jgi:DNA-binding transcriptional LysR family regulator